MKMIKVTKNKGNRNEKMKRNKGKGFDRDVFNLLVIGYGGQGVLTLAEIISKAAFKEGYDVKQTEVHGLAQRGGTLDCNIRFGKKVWSPTISKAEANMVIALEATEALRALRYANEKTIFIINSKLFRSNLKITEVKKEISKITKRIYFIDADKIAKEETCTSSISNILLLGYALKKKALPLKKESVLQTIKEKIKPQFIDINLKVFKKAFSVK